MLKKTPAATLAGGVKLSSLPANGAFRELVSISVNAAAPTNMSRAALAVRGDGTAADLFAGGRSTDTEAQQTLTADANIAQDVFTHVAAVFDFVGDTIRVYKNGVLVTSGLVNFSQAATPDTASTNGALGAQDLADSNFLHGLLDDVRVYCRILTSEEIQKLATVAPPAAPTNLDAVAGDTKVTLSWTASAGATSYNVYRRLAATSYGAPIANVAANGHVDLGLANGTEYFYRVTALNAAGESPFSNEDSAIPQPAGQPPAKPVITTPSGATNDNTPTIVGTAAPTVSVAVAFKQGATTVETLNTSSDFLGNWSVTASAKPDGVYTVTATASNGFGPSPQSDPITLTIDTVAPALASVTSTSANGAYPAGSAINVTVTFSEPVTLAGGDLLVSLNTGSVVSIAPFGPAISAVGTYTVQAGQNVADLTAASPLTLAAGASLADPSGNSAILTVPGGSNLGDLKDIVVDTQAPGILSVSSATPDGSYSVGASIGITVTFTEQVTLAGGNLQVLLDTGATVSIAPFGPALSAAGTYVVAAGHNSADLNAASPLTLQAGATLRDAALNPAGLTIPANGNLAFLKDILIDTSAPAIVNVTSTTADGTYGVGASIDVTVNFFEPVSLVGGNLRVTLNTGAIILIPPFTSLSSVAGTYVVAAGQNTPDLTAASPLTLDGGATLRDLAGNNANLAIPSGSNLGDLKNIAIVTPPPTAPLPPASVWLTSYASAIDVEWTASPSLPAQVAGYHVYRKLATDPTWPATPLNMLRPVPGVVLGTKYRDATVTQGLVYQYRVTAVGN
jgi:hypothetical protein